MYDMILHYNLIFFSQSGSIKYVSKLSYRMGFVLHSEVCCKGKKSFGHHGHSHGNSNRRNRHDHSYSPLIDERSEHEIELESQEDHPKHVHHKNINIRAAFIHVIGDIIQSVGVLIASFIIKFMVSDIKFFFFFLKFSQIIYTCSCKFRNEYNVFIIAKSMND